MPKRNVAFVKPDEPSFLKKLKQQIGFKEGPTLDTKRRKLCELDCDGEDRGDAAAERDEEQPQIVVLNSGDLDAKQVEEEKKRLQIEENNKRADLGKRVIFHPTSASVKTNCHQVKSALSKTGSSSAATRSTSASVSTTAVAISPPVVAACQPTNRFNDKLLSFDIDEEEEEI